MTIITRNATDGVWPDYLAAEARADALDAAPAAATDEEIDAVYIPFNRAVDAVLAAPVATLTDVERKLRAARRSFGDTVPEELLPDLLAQVRAATGTAV